MITLADAVRNVMSLGIDEARVSELASSDACALLGDPSRGVLEHGRNADIVAITPDSDTPVRTWIAGVEVHG